MKAISYSAFGGPEVLDVVDVPKPEPTGDQVLVQVHTIGINPFEVKQRAGMFGGDLPKIPGTDIAGSIVELGPDAEGLEIGQRVFGFAVSQGYAEYVVATAVVPLPDGLDPADAVALLVPGTAARRGLAQTGIQRGETLLINGASGAVGTIAVQLAIASGVTVVGTAGPDEQDALRELGAIPTVYGDGIADRVRQLAPKIDAALDLGGHGFVQAAAEVAPGQRIVSLVDPSVAEVGGVFSGGGPGDRDPVQLTELAELAASGAIVLPPPRAFGFADVSSAHQAVENGGRGKVVLTL